MISEKMTQALNKQINEELYSAYLYLSMSAHSESKGLHGFAHWLKAQYREETEHAMKMYQYLLDQGAPVKLQAIAEPPAEFGKEREMFEQVLKHEQHITKCIYDLVETAIAEKDYATHTFLQWFVMEQVEEEASAGEILDKLKMVGDKVNALFMIDRNLGMRK